MMTHYLQELNDRIAAGIAQLPESLRQRHARYFIANQPATAAGASMAATVS